MKKFALGLALLSALAVGACGDDGAGPDSVDGSYALVTVNGGTLPFTVFQIGNDRGEVTAGRMDIEDDATFDVSLTFRETIGGQTTTETDNATGTWTMSGSQITFSMEDGGSATGVVDGDRLTIATEPEEDEISLTLVFEK